MAMPLHSANRERQNLQFTHFGVLDIGGNNKGSLFTSIGINVLLAVIALIVSAAAVKISQDNKLKEVTYVVPVAKPPEPPKPRLIPPKPVPRPEIKPVEPKVLLPKVAPPVVPKPMPVPMPKPVPVVTPAPPKAVVAAAAPKPVAVHLGAAASVTNHDTHPAAVSLGQANNPIAPSNRPATATVNLGNAGLAGMPPGTGRGPSSTAVNLGSGQPGGSISGSGSRGVVGVKLGGVTNGTPNGTGNGVGTRPQQVALGHTPPPPTSTATSLAHLPARQGPQVIYKPRPQYTAEATAAKIEGVVAVRIRVSSTGVVSVIGVSSGLGHGLDESAIRAVQATRFRPAVDASGSPVDWEGVVNISFQMAS
jgi:periplasmic protein TonB